MVYRTRIITAEVRLSYRTDRRDRTNRITLCPDVIMRCMLHMSPDHTDRTNRNALCPDVIIRCTLRMSTDRKDGMNRNALCPTVIMRCTLHMSTDRMDRTNRNTLCPDLIIRWTFRMSTDRTDRTNHNTLCPHVIMRCRLRMCSAYRPWVIVTVCAERMVCQLLLTVCNSAAVLKWLSNDTHKTHHFGITWASSATIPNRLIWYTGIWIIFLHFSLRIRASGLAKTTE